MTAATIPPVVPILVSAYACACQRCRHQWVSTCECHALPLDVDEHGVAEVGPIVAHARDCKPPRACPGCKQVGWDRPRAWTNKRAPKAARRKR